MIQGSLRSINRGSRLKKQGKVQHDKKETKLSSFYGDEQTSLNFNP
jgi:hypothetical protein